MIYSVSSKGSGVLAKLLNMSITHPYEFYGDGSDLYKDVDRGRKDNEPDINYGVRESWIPKTCLNYHAEKAFDKLKCFEIFDNLNIPHPKLIDPLTYDYCFLGRKNFKSKGEGIVKFKAKSESYQKNKSFYDFTVEFIKGVREYRVHVFQGEVLLEVEKDFTHNSHPFIRNVVNGSIARPSYIKHKNRLDALNWSIEAVKGVGLDFAAVDLIEGEDGRLLVLECNSGPLLNGSIPYIYADYISRRFSLEINRYWNIGLDGKLIDHRKFLKKFVEVV